MDKENEMLTVTQTAAELQVTINTVYARINDGSLPATFNPAVKSRRWQVYREGVDLLKKSRYYPVQAGKPK
jgi:predicted DNA-binding transcriptional regulator AlpA